jgi:hypothetical protein
MFLANLTTVLVLFAISIASGAVKVRLKFLCPGGRDQSSYLSICQVNSQLVTLQEKTEKGHPKSLIKLWFSEEIRGRQGRDRDI